MNIKKLGDLLSIMLAVGIVAFWIAPAPGIVLMDMTLCIIRLSLCLYEYGFEEVTDDAYFQGLGEV